MGSHSTKVVAAPLVEAAASPVAPAQQHHKRSSQTNETGPCQDHIDLAARGTMTLSQLCDDIDLKFPTQSTTTSRRRYSEPVQTAAMTTELNADGIQHLVAFERFLAERELTAIDIDYASLVSSVPVEHLPNLAASAPIDEVFEQPEPEVQCIGCCTQLPKEKDPKHVQEAIRPCRSCNSAYCIPCVIGIFLSACKDPTRMPPRCCTQIHLHHIKSHLTTEEITEYRSKYEEWSTPKPFYCPMPTCSTFIPERLLSQQAGVKGKRKVDSGIGTPTSPNFRCPKCEGEICVDCRQLAHPDSICAILDLGVDMQTAALLKAWGYKRCPKCSQGLKRMYGCNHMECRCGAHFCWGCMKSRGECEGGCYEDDDVYDGSDFEPDEPETLPGSDEDATNEAHAVTAGGVEAAIKAHEEDVTDVPGTSQAVSRPRNLDGGSSHYWEEQSLDFGEEPTDDVQDRTWECHHSFEPYTISLTEAISKLPSAQEMECVKCWCAIQPDIETPQKSTKITCVPLPHSGNGVVAVRSRVAYGRRGRGRGMVARPRPAAYVAPRGLVRSDASVGTAPHLTTPLESNCMFHPGTHSDPMEDIQSALEADFKATESAVSQKATLAYPTSNVFSNISTTYSVAQECHSCSLLACKNCADSIIAQQLAKQEAREAELAAEAADAAEPEVKAEEET